MSGGSLFRRLLLPGLAFKSVVIGGGYATGRELAEFFLPSGAWGGLAAMALTMAMWSLVCALTFLVARGIGSLDYRSLLQRLLGRGWFLFEITYLSLVVLVIAVFGAAAGELGIAVAGWSPLAGTLVLAAIVAAVVLAGNEAVEGLFKYMSLLLYAVYAVTIVLVIARFGPEISGTMQATAGTQGGWARDGLSYAGYNMLGAVAILPVVRHMVRRRDAMIAGLLAGPLAILPAVLFFICMLAFQPEIADQALPSDYLLGELGVGWLHLAFRIMIFIALVETGVALVNSIVLRIGSAWSDRTGRSLSARGRVAVILAILALTVFLADAIGLVALIANGYRLLAWGLLATYVLPLLVYGIRELWLHRSAAFQAERVPAQDGS